MYYSNKNKINYFIKYRTIIISVIICLFIFYWLQFAHEVTTVKSNNKSKGYANYISTLIIYPKRRSHEQPNKIILAYGTVPINSTKIVTRFLRLQIAPSKETFYIEAISIRPRILSPYYVITIDGQTYPMQNDFTYLSKRLKISSIEAMKLAVSFVGPKSRFKQSSYPTFDFGAHLSVHGTFGSVDIQLQTAVAQANSVDYPYASSKMLPVGTFDALIKQPLTKEAIERGIGLECEGHGDTLWKLKGGGNLSDSCHHLLKTTSLYLHNLFEKHNVSYWAMKGTLLGLIRDKGIIPWDYDMDYAFKWTDINKVFALRKQMWDDGYIMFSPPWRRYQNYQFVITMRTNKVIQSLLDQLSNSVSQTMHVYQRDDLRAVLSTEAWRMTTEMEQVGAWIELMAFAPVDNNKALSQVLCTEQYHSMPTANFTLNLSPHLDEDWLEGHAYNQRQSALFNPTVEAGWLTYANTLWDYEYKNYMDQFNGYNIHKYCMRTAPVSFRYDFVAADVFPLKKVQFYNGELYVPNRPDKVLEYYIGPDWSSPKRRFS